MAFGDRPRSGRRSGQFNPKAAASAQLGLDTHLAAHAEHGSANDGQTEARPFVAAVHTLEKAENLRLMLRGYADAVVRKPQPDEAVLLFGPNVHSGNDSWSHELYGIAEQVRDALGKGNGVSDQRRQRALHLNLRQGTLEGGRGKENALQKRFQIDRPKLYVRSAQPAECQDVLDQVVHAVRCANDTLQRSRSLDSSTCLAQHLGEPRDAISVNAFAREILMASSPSRAT